MPSLEAGLRSPENRLSVLLRVALVDLGTGLWHSEPVSRTYGTELRARGKPGGIIITAMAHRANKIAFAMVRDQKTWETSRWAA